MQIHTALKKTGRSAATKILILLAGGLLGGTPIPIAHAADVNFSAEVDRAILSAEDSVSLKMVVQTDGNMNIGQPEFSAPDFDLVNEYNSVFVQSYYENGRFGMRNNHQITKVLKPLKTGDLRISKLIVKVNGQQHTAPDIIVKVTPGGSGTPPPRGYGGSGSGLRGAAKHAAKNVLIRAEVSKEHAYKGEQIIVSYYLYTRVRTFNIQVQKYPIHNGFLREELEMPVNSPTGRLSPERVVLDGVAYERSLLARYAIYPLNEGKLKIDPLSLKYAYQPNRNGGGLDLDEDPFMQFFQALTPRTAIDRSDPVTIEVEAIPNEGRPTSFSGGVGDFNVSSAIDKYEVRANEAVLLTVKVEGRGNLASIEEPKTKWPENIELYDSKGHSKSGRAGIGEKIFEFLLIPRAEGKLDIPALDFSFFDPEKKAYVTRSTEPISLAVSPPAPGSAGNVRLNRPAGPAPQSTPNSSNAELRYLKPPKGDAGIFNTPFFGGNPIWRWLYWLTIGAFGIFAILVGFDLFKTGSASARALLESKAKLHAKSWERIRAGARAATHGASWQEVTQTYELMTNAIFDALERVYPIGVRSLPRTELKSILVDERGLAKPLWDRADRILEFAEMVRFASSAGAISEDAARAELAKWVNEAHSIVRILDSTSQK
ncbi:MAG: hypothetical protein A2428_13110 [Bdellovibrionales bacterium RIFOXYC1_FULL_54_43]|nr:MAG: hypothetical protein A2428_13110 [Bdellovibrionales bacterium RIFOXYC1_FULL_54_43]OFZ85107.1 MAG: hypothetical protein A2603_07180 [Bdellovibrionales bacterium RIFOXYD1_FULL_55_31]